MGRVDGKVALITGGARGMGASHARHLVAEGAKVVIADVLDEDGERTAAELGEACTYTHLDVTDRERWAAAVARAVGSYGGLDVLVNNAGIANFGTIDEYTYDQWDTVIAINLTGVFNGIKAAVPELRRSRRNPSIINISSTAGLQGYEALPGYTAAKHGVRGLTKAVALDLAPSIRCNSIHPGVISTPMTADLELPQTHVALKRAGNPAEVSQLVVYLASDESTFCTGAEFVVDGGELAGLAH